MAAPRSGVAFGSGRGRCGGGSTPGGPGPAASPGGRAAECVGRSRSGGGGNLSAGSEAGAGGSRDHGKYQPSEVRAVLEQARLLGTHLN
eukprot:6189793-Pleurochrysis_carterae.AAC.1